MEMMTHMGAGMTVMDNVRIVKKYRMADCLML